MNFFTQAALGRSLALGVLSAGLAFAQRDCTLPAGPLPERSRYVVMLDVSGSMVGKGDGRFDIFGQVERELGRFLQDTSSASTVRLVTFSRGVEASRDFDYPQQKAALGAYLAGLKPDGTRTYLYRSMQRVFAGLRRDATLATTVYVLTDGNDNDPRPVSLRGALDTFGRSRGPFDKLYYIGLGTNIPRAAETAFDATAYARTLEVPAQVVPQLGGFGLLPALLELSRGKLTRSGKLGEDVRLRLDSARYPGLKLGQDRLSAGQGRLQLTVDPARPGTPQAAALLCVDGTTLSERALVRPGQGGPGTAGQAAGPAGAAQASAGRLRLTLLNPGARRTLAPGETTTLRYRVQGPAGARGTVTFGDLPAGLQATVNGRPLAGPVAARAGETLALTLRNGGLAAGQDVTVAPSLNGVRAQSQSVAAGGAANTAGSSSAPEARQTPKARSGLRLVLLNPKARRDLAPGEETTLNYRLEGPAGQSGQVAFGALPAGVQATVNGEPLRGPLTVRAGDTVALTLRNVALGAGQAVSLAPTLNGQPAAAQQVSGRAAATAPVASPPQAPGRVVLLNPEAKRNLARGNSVVLRYRAEGGPATVTLGAAPTGTAVGFEGHGGSTLRVPAGGEFGVRVTNTALGSGQATTPDVRADGVPVVAPLITAARAGFGWGWLGLLGLLGLLPLLFRRAMPRGAVPVGPAPAAVAVPTAVPGGSAAAVSPAPGTVQLLEERLVADKERYVAQQVEIGKRVETRTEQVEVPVQREEAYIERRPVHDNQPVDGALLGAPSGPLRVELEAERAVVDKRAVVAEEVEISKRTTREQQTLTGTVGREVLDVRSTGDARVVDGAEQDEEPGSRRP